MAKLAGGEHKTLNAANVAKKKKKDANVAKLAGGEVLNAANVAKRKRDANVAKLAGGENLTLNAFESAVGFDHGCIWRCNRCDGRDRAHVSKTPRTVSPKFLRLRKIRSDTVSPKLFRPRTIRSVVGQGQFLRGQFLRVSPTADDPCDTVLCDAFIRFL